MLTNSRYFANWRLLCGVKNPVAPVNQDLAGMARQLCRRRKNNYINHHQLKQMKQLNELAAEKNALTEKGQFVDAIEKFFAADAKTVDFSGAKVNGKDAILKGQKKTVESIAKVNQITLLSSGVGDEVSYAEFIFDFETKDGTHIKWHEVILSKWKNGHIVHEEYYKGL
jgi:hypothetical protein